MSSTRVDEALSFQASSEYVSLLRQSSELNYPLAAPYQMSLAVWGRCNSPCGYCLNWKGRDPNPSTATLTRLLHEARDLGVTQILFSGGEPTLRPDLLDILRLAKNIGFDVLLITNGLRLTPDYVAELGDLGCKKIGLSLDSLDPDRYRSIRGVRLDRVLESLDLLSTAQREDPDRFHVSILVTISRKNISDLIPLMYEARGRGIAVQYQPVNFDEYTAPSMREAFWPNPDEITMIEEAMQVIVDRKKQGWAISNRLEFLQAFPTYFREGTFHPAHCYNPFAQVVVDQYMNLRPCWAMDGVAKVGVDEPLKTLWFSEKMSQVRQVVRQNKCPGCTYSCHLSKDYIDYE